LITTDHIAFHILLFLVFAADASDYLFLFPILTRSRGRLGGGFAVLVFRAFHFAFLRGGISWEFEVLVLAFCGSA
jgi:hypothetical protein